MDPFQQQPGGLQGLLNLITQQGRPFSDFTNEVRRSVTGRGITDEERQRIDNPMTLKDYEAHRRRRPVTRRYVDSTTGDVLDYPAKQGLRLTTHDLEDDDARELKEPFVRVPAEMLELPKWDRAREIERLRFQQIEEPRRHEWAPGSLPQIPLGLERLFTPGGGR